MGAGPPLSGQASRARSIGSSISRERGCTVPSRSPRSSPGDQRTPTGQSALIRRNDHMHSEAPKLQFLFDRSVLGLCLRNVHRGNRGKGPTRQARPSTEARFRRSKLVQVVGYRLVDFVQKNLSGFCFGSAKFVIRFGLQGTIECSQCRLELGRPSVVSAPEVWSEML